MVVEGKRGGREGGSEAENGQKNGGTSSPKCFDCLRGGLRGTKRDQMPKWPKRAKFRIFWTQMVVLI